ncbi:MAG: SDR family oxidoreductase [Syntrophomonadaceae bacterium]|nr:SDR family oxidoreductase [Syntrophomonadaceae bacterium]
MISSMFDISGKKAIVTGGTRGLGHGMAEALLEAGCEVSIIGSSDMIFDVAEDFKKKGYSCYGVKADLRNRKEVYRSFEEALAYLRGDLDILVTAAGIQRRHSAEEFPIEEWDEVLSINLNAVFIQCQLAGRIMLKKGYGKIINIASMASFFGGQTVPAYSAAKGGVMQLTKELTNDWAGRGINVNAIAPGYMATEMNSALLANETRNKQISDRIPARRWGCPEDMKGVTIFLASKASDYVNGAIIPVDGGYLVK